jgi:L-threonylcarbamoyladenylate synthase
VPIIEPSSLGEIVDAICHGDVVGIPTDTVYGLAALPDNECVLRQLTQLKGRPEAQPFAVLFDSIDAVSNSIEDPELLQKLTPYWPGPLTAIVRVKAGVLPVAVTPKGTLGLRTPADKLTRDLIRACGGSLAVTSANRSGEEPAKNASQVIEIFGDELLVLDGGPRNNNRPSTIIDLSVNPPSVIRDGPIDGTAVLTNLAKT